MWTASLHAMPPPPKIPANKIKKPSDEQILARFHATNVPPITRRVAPFTQPLLNADRRSGRFPWQHKIDPVTGEYIPLQRERTAIDKHWNYLNGVDPRFHGYEHGQLYEEGRRGGKVGLHPTYTGRGRTNVVGQRQVTMPRYDTKVGLRAHVMIHSHPGGRQWAYEPPSRADHVQAARMYGHGRRTQSFIADWDNRRTQRTFWVDPKKTEYRIVSQTKVRPHVHSVSQVSEHWGHDGPTGAWGHTRPNTVRERAGRSTAARARRAPVRRGVNVRFNRGPGGRRRR
jgi:hypothetical protein